MVELPIRLHSDGRIEGCVIEALLWSVVLSEHSDFYTNLEF